MVAETNLSSPSAPSGGDGAPPRPPPKRRKRAVISCVECHRRKQKVSFAQLSENGQKSPGLPITARNFQSTRGFTLNITLARKKNLADDPKCDRELPCSNCKFRNKESACRYESTTSRPLSHDPARPLRFDSPRDSAEQPYARRATESPLAATTQKLNSTHLSASPPQALDPEVQRRRYKDLVRQLPTGPLVDHLVEVYFRDINWQYYPLEHSEFLWQLAEWRRTPLHVFSSGGPSALPSEMRAFPALLFQVLANALLVVPDGIGGPFETLKYTGAMALQDLAEDYCESGEALLGLLGRDVSLTGVQAKLLRSLFFKTCLRIMDAVCLLTDVDER